MCALAALKALGAVAEPEVKFFYEHTLANAREQLGGPAFQSAREQGSHWSLAEAVRRALEQ